MSSYDQRYITMRRTRRRLIMASRLVGATGGTISFVMIIGSVLFLQLAVPLVLLFAMVIFVVPETLLVRKIRALNRQLVEEGGLCPACGTALDREASQERHRCVQCGYRLPSHPVGMLGRRDDV